VSQNQTLKKTFYELLVWVIFKLDFSKSRSFSRNFFE